MSNATSTDSSELRQQIKELIIDRLRLEDVTIDQIGDETPLWGEEGLGLDSIDALELVTALETELGLRIDDAEMEPESLANVAQLEQLVLSMRVEKEGATP